MITSIRKFRYSFSIKVIARGWKFFFQILVANGSPTYPKPTTHSFISLSENIRILLRNLIKNYDSFLMFILFLIKTNKQANKNPMPVMDITITDLNGFDFNFRYHGSTNCHKHKFWAQLTFFLYLSFKIKS